MTAGESVRICKALADETRTEIVKLLKEGELCARDILEHFRISQPTLSYHMKALCGCGAVTQRKQGLWSYYSLNCGRIREWLRYISGDLLED